MSQNLTKNSAVQFTVNRKKSQAGDVVDLSQAAYEPQVIGAYLRAINRPLYVIEQEGKIGLISADCDEQTFRKQTGVRYITGVPALPIEDLGDAGFKKTYRVRCAYYAGSMANGIASVEMVVALGKAGLLGSFGAAGLVRSRLESAIQGIQVALPDGPYAANLIHSPSEDALERNAVEVYLQYGVHVVEASAFIDLTPSIVYYRAAGLSQSGDGEVEIANHVIAKLSRREVATKFMQPAPENILDQLVSEGRITPQQAGLAKKVPMADDITVEADSGGHTDNRPLVCLLPTMLALRDEIQAKYNYPVPVRVGAAGGISTPASALAAFMMGAAYIVTGSVNQSCVEAGASEHTRQLLAQAGMADVAMAPSADMFEMGVKVQVLKHGTLFPMRAQKLYDLYSRYDSIEQIPADEREKLEKQVFKRDIESIWQDTVKFFTERDPAQIERAQNNPKRKMALIFRWYLGLASRWSNSGEKGREMDYQIWCGPAMGSFNDWARGTYLAGPENRRVADVALQILTGAACQYRLQTLKLQGLQIPAELEQYYPTEPLLK
ncbi:MAG: PfaD family polyunsaturated fatty acid/polyketide biosynthesis protein [Chloroflexi bacterium]|nr:PfaD family polyunsaturated fatty acid/polyketide biosynthesis protein [Chloroflexota bacterium]